MPKFLEERLKASGRKHGFIGKKLDRYVFGSMNNSGVMHGNKETAKGKAMAEKHRRDAKTPKTFGELYGRR